MKSFLFAASVAVIALNTPTFAADVGISVSIGQPGFYGQIEIGNYPSRPPVIYSQPRIIQRTTVLRDPVYLRVPPGHRKNWSKHCSQYNACGEQVYFVQDSWYEREYVPRYQEQHRDRQDDRRDDRSDERRGDRGDDRRDDRSDNHGNKGNDRGKGHGRGNH